MGNLGRGALSVGFQGGEHSQMGVSGPHCSSDSLRAEQYLEAGALPVSPDLGVMPLEFRALAASDTPANTDQGPVSRPEHA